MGVRYGILVLSTAVSLLAGHPGPVRADDTNTSAVILPEEQAGPEVYPLQPDTLEQQAPREVHIQGNGFTGYRFVGNRGMSGNAYRYDYLHSGIIGGVSLDGAGNDLQYFLDGKYINDKDYYGDFAYDFEARYRLHLRTETLFHHTWKDSLSPSFSTATSTYGTIDQNPTARFGQRVEQDLAQFRYKLSNYPLHFNLGYWRLIREGNGQLIYSDQQFGLPAATAANMVFSSPRRIQRETHEGRAGFDTHLGPVDLVYSFLIRDFMDSAGIPRDAFSARIPGETVLLQHNEDPDSRYVAHTVKLHTSLDGGITGGASYTLGERTNRSGLTDFAGAEETRSTLHNVAGDFTYTPCGSFSLAVKYRRQEVENSTPSSLSAPSLVNQTFSVRPGFTTSRDTVTATMAVRPFRLTTVKGEYRAEVLDHDFRENPDQSLNWHLMSEESITHRGTFTILSRPLKSLRLKAQYSFATTDTPEYSSSIQDEHKGELLATYANPAWGATFRYFIKKGMTDNPRQIIPTSSAPLAYAPSSPIAARTATTNDGTISVWMSPMEPFTITGSYGHLQLDIDQGILFTSGISPLQDLATYSSHADFYSIDATYRINNKTSVSLGLQQIRSAAEFSPEPLSAPPESSTAGIAELSRIRTVETAVSSRIGYQFSKTVDCSLDYSYRDYDDRFGTAADSTAQVVMAWVQGRW